MSTFRHLATLSFLLSFAAMCVRAGTIDFEDLTDSTSVTTQYAGLSFANATVITAGISLNEFEFPPHSGTNVVFDDGGSLSITFDNPVSYVAGYLTYEAAVSLKAFDSLILLCHKT